MHISSEIWDTLQVDSVVISSPFTTGLLDRHTYSISFYVDPSKYNQFTFQLIENGIEGETFTKQIYVPNFYNGDGSASNLFYNVEF